MDMPRRTAGEWVQTICDLILLNILWLICSLPIITIGASTAALHSVVRKMAACEYYTVWSGFWHGFHENWKQGTAAALILGLVLGISWFDFTRGLRSPGLTGIFCQLPASRAWRRRNGSSSALTRVLSFTGARSGASALSSTSRRRTHGCRLKPMGISTSTACGFPAP